MGDTQKNALKNRNLMDQLWELEKSLDRFSYSELPIQEANGLKSLLAQFKEKLELNFFGAPHATGKPEEPTAEHETQPKEAELMERLGNRLRSPLNDIMELTELLQESGLTQEQLEYVASVRNSSKAALDTVQELTDYALLSNGTEPFEQHPFNLRSLVHEVVFLKRTLILDHNTSLSVAISPEIPDLVLGDPTKLSQLLMTLLGNALEHTNSGAISLEIASVAVTKDQEEISFTVRHQGEGLDPNRIQDLFVPLSQETSGPHSGWDMSMVKKIVERWEGELYVASQPGNGAVFKCILPFKQPKINGLEGFGNEPHCPINLSKWWLKCEGDKDRFQRTIREFQLQVLDFTGRTKLAMEMEDGERIRLASIHLMPSLKQIGCYGLMDLCKKLALQCVQHNWPGIGQTYNVFLKEYALLEQEIADFMDTL